MTNYGSVQWKFETNFQQVRNQLKTDAFYDPPTTVDSAVAAVDYWTFRNITKSVMISAYLRLGVMPDAVSKDSFVLDATTLAWSRLEVGLEFQGISRGCSVWGLGYI